VSLTTGLTLTSCHRRCGNSKLRTLARTPVALDLELPTPLPNNLLGYIYLVLENTIQLGGGDLPELILDDGPQLVQSLANRGVAGWRAAHGRRQRWTERGRSTL
jgi:hypothetical protein